jgi:hypothetical protein
MPPIVHALAEHRLWPQTVLVSSAQWPLALRQNDVGRLGFPFEESVDIEPVPIGKHIGGNVEFQAHEITKPLRDYQVFFDSWRKLARRPKFVKSESTTLNTAAPPPASPRRQYSPTYLRGFAMFSVPIQCSICPLRCIFLGQRLFRKHSG